MDLRPGQTATRSLTLTSEHVQKYYKITGDRNPLHFDPEFTAKTKFGKLVVQGGLTTACFTLWWPWTSPAPAAFL